MNGQPPQRNDVEGRQSDSGAPLALPKKKGKPGPKVPADWPEKFLEYYRQCGTRWLSARRAGTSHDVVTRREAADPHFAAQVETARMEYADSLEENMDRLTRKKSNVIAGIVMLKKHRPQDFIERKSELHVHAHAALTQADGRALLAAMLAQATDATLRELAQHGSGGFTVEAGRVEDPPADDGQHLALSPGDPPS
jgi:hypothetical protein